MKKRLLVGAVAGASALALMLTGCGGSGSGAPSTDSAQGGDTPVKGGTVTWLDIASQFTSTDPVGVYLGEEIAGLRRLTYRGLTAMTVSKSPNAKVVPDLAADTGKTTDAGKTWTFKLKQGPKWQDGSPITCADFQYGLSRSFDANLSGPPGGVGTTYMSQYGLYDPADPSFDLSTKYTGPSSSDAEAQKHFDAAASCDGDSITYHFQNAWPDFPTAAAALFTTDPYQKSFDKGVQSLWTINSNGPYMLDGGTAFDPAKGGTFVRNTNYDASTDSKDVRGAYPDKVNLEIAADQETVTERLIADASADQTAFTPGNIPSSKYSEITPDLSSRVVQSTSPYTRFIEINYLTVTDKDERRALQLATNKTGVITALGGDKYGTPTSTIVSSAITGYKPNPSTKDDKAGGDAAAAKKLLNGKTPAIRFAFSDTASWQKVAAVLQQSWSEAGFQVTLVPIPTNAKPGYYAQVLQKDKPIDAFMGGWASDWPSLFGVIPPILQSNPAGSTSGVGFNYGFYSNADVDKDIAAAVASTDPATQTSKLLDADQKAAADGAYIPLLNQKNYFIYGSKIGGFLPDAASSYYPDLGGMFVKK